jgi:DNA-nicking Smr family endonuclease
MAGRRRRSLSAEERALWEQVASGARPLRPPPAGTAVPPPEPAPPPPAPPPPARAAAPGRPAPATDPSDARPQMDRRRFDRLRRGRLEPEARLDLHGMDSARAHARLTDFIVRAHADGLRLVLVITGKGRAGEGDGIMPRRSGILRHSLPHWLGAPPLMARILEVAPAHARHGGAGAFYVYLRRVR